MKDKICIITGANSGIGKETALALAKKGAHILMICRNAKKAEQARQEIVETSRNESIEVLLADFSIQTQIHEVAKEILSKVNRVDILVNNAGLIAKSYREITADNLEMTFAVNHMGYFILTHLLLDALKASPQGRVINVASEGHRFYPLDLNDLQLEKGYSSMRAYCCSKLCNILFTRELAKQLSDTNVTANAAHPGIVATNFAKNNSSLFGWMFKYGKVFFQSSEQGAETSIYLASNPELSGISGKYFSKQKIRMPSRDAMDEQKAKDLWEISTKLANFDTEGA